MFDEVADKVRDEVAKLWVLGWLWLASSASSHSVCNHGCGTL
jgi:hypothetical protein